MSGLAWAGIGVGLIVAFYLAQTIYLSAVLAWEDQKTRGLGYYGLPPAERRAFKRRLERHARLLRPVLAVTAKPNRFSFARASFSHQGVAGPKGSCSEATFKAAAEYAPRPEDVFVATQMKCGTTWMQHVVYEVLHRGDGNLAESGTALYAVSPWIEGFRSVPLDQAPLLGAARPSRLIKTHLPAQLCPAGPGARFVYVARHPVACFASCIDFLATNLGPMTPPVPAIEAWFRSPDSMWWGTWPDHVGGWWDRSLRDGNVLFVHFEEMKGDLAAVVERVNGFLGLPALEPDRLERIVKKCGFAYMQRHQEAFEMHPPHVLQTNAELFVRGTADRHLDVPPETRRGIQRWCATAMADSSYPLARFYPEVAAGG